MSKRSRSKVARQKLSLRESLWPNIKTDVLWDRAVSDGWLSIPRALPILNQIMDSLSKGKPVSATYLDLWCRTFDDSFVIANKSREMAFFSGFNGERAERTWISRIRTLEELGFIKVEAGPNGPISYILLLNPYKVTKELHIRGLIPNNLYNALLHRMIEIGANDLDESTIDNSVQATSLPKTRVKLPVPPPPPSNNKD